MKHSLEYLRSVLSYNPSTGLFTWRGRNHCGQRAGTTDHRGYIKIAVETVGYKAHRLAWMFFVGAEIPSSVHIDHINGDPADNRIENLRPCTPKENQENSRRPKNSSTGFKGVAKCGDRFRSYICHNRKQIHLGVFASAEDAHSAYVRAAKNLGWEIHRAE